ncbi:FG-GAP-like repeat-containing protein [Streptomyces sp. WMMC940]|uniref:FG-GAP-like repeat-containing protein n=1 Tax=Streptomyces sp. WMMC940 TaxID=3015153 RepID=UPI0022B65AB9|nr:FG-GAP-like repeat-containing protein [Streptomyces sp. WMMC940]MCZ7459402.1 FG-GAP-like repeat-containing protein [Streptomyces sp. WMMC940]
MSRTSNARVRGNGRTRAALVLALATVTATGSGILTPSATAAPLSAAVAGDVTVLPPAQRFAPRATSILTAGETGYLLLQENDDRLLWIDYATGSATPLATRLPEKPRYDPETGYWDHLQRLPIGGGGYYGDGSDTVALYSASPAPHVTLQKGAGAVFADVRLPEGQSYVSTFGDTVLTRTGEAGGAPTGYHLLRHEGGTVTDTPVTGFPEGAVLQGVEDGDAKSVIIRYAVPGEPNQRWRIVDLAEAVAKPLPDRPDPDEPWVVDGFRLGGESVLRLRTGRSKADVLDRTAPDNVIRTVETGVVSYDATFATVGGSVLAVDRQNPGDNEYRGTTLWRIPDDDGDLEQVLQLADEQVAVAPDGSLLIAGATTAPARGDVDWAVHRILPKADGSLETRRLATVEPMPAHVYGLSLGSGILTTADDSTLFEPFTNIGAYRSTWLNTTGEPQAVRTTVDGLVSGRDSDCAGGSTAERCVTMWASGDGFHGRGNGTESGLTMLFENGRANWGPRLTTGFHSPEPTDLSGRFGVVRPASRGTQAVVEFRRPDSGAVLEKRTEVAAAVWGSILWSGGKDTGAVTSKTLPSGTAGESFTTLDKCVPNELQAVGRWVYWKCENASGVYDRQARRAVAAPLGSVLLGDGYFVHRGDGTGLTLYDLHAGLPASGAAADVPHRTLVSAAALGGSVVRRAGWTVDRFGGHVAYVGADERVRVVRTGVPASAITAIDSVVSAGTFDPTVAGARWAGSWWVSKPAAAWQLTVKRADTGAVVRTVSGSEGRGLIEAAWDGKDGAGKAVPGGTYRWTLTAQPSDGVGAPLVTSGDVDVVGALPPPAFRDLAGADRVGDLVSLSSAGAFAYRHGNGAGGLSGATTGHGWSTSAVAVPFGDLNGDRCNDVLVRLGSELRAYRPGCGKALTPTTPYTSLGSVWAQFNVLTSPGDLTGDGRPDMVARQASTGDVYLYADDGAGKLKARGRIGTNWKLYRAIFGAGDLNGDGIGDLLAVDGANSLWRYDGTATGTVKPRALVFAKNWGTGRNVFVGVGDLNRDGKPDLISRNAAGDLLRNNGNGAGSFGSTVRIGTGWQGYKGLF